MTHVAKVHISSPKDMRIFAEGIGKHLAGGSVLLLEGELGAGKTTFVQALAKVLGVQEDVDSPTYTIVGEYVANYSDITTLVHADLYRLSAQQVEHDPMIADLISSSAAPDRVTVIEWADRLRHLAPPNAMRIKFEHGDKEHERIISMLST